ncbi:MAG: iron-containing alcohol dehydrogenase [Erysipelotrichaceae bacterium]
MHLLAKIKTTIIKPIMRIMNFPVPVTYIGSGKIKEITTILEYQRSEKVLIITDKNIVKLGLINDTITSIRKANIEVVIYQGVKPDPTFAIVDEALEFSKDCDSVIAIGGGSVLDTAKVVAAAASNNVTSKKLKGLLKVKKASLNLICVPTTAGTGSEATIVAVISDNVTHAKTTIIDPKLVPSVAILDPDLTVGLPRSISVETAMDALTHALESYISDYATVQTKRYCEIAIKMIYQHLPIVYQTPSDIDSREKLLLASFYAGMAFTRTYVGYVHAFSHNIGAKYSIAHGLANAVLLPHIMDYYQEVCQADFAVLANIVGLSESNDSIKQRSEKFVASIHNLNDKMAITKSLAAFDQEKILEIIKAAFKEAHGTYPVAKFMSKKEAIEILNKVCS